jgi:SAM-dependent methyltransferase
LGATLQDLGTLDDDWDGYGAFAPTRQALERAWYLFLTPSPAWWKHCFVSGTGDASGQRQRGPRPGDFDFDRTVASGPEAQLLQARASDGVGATARRWLTARVARDLLMAPTEDDRVGQVYGAYANDPRKAAAWASDNPGNRAIREEVAAVIVPFALATAGPVLDAGCGTGWWLGRLADAGAASGRLTGVDLLPERAAAAAKGAPGATLRTADIRTLPFADGHFELVFLLTVLSSLHDACDVRRALTEAARVTAPGGRVVIWEPRVPTLNRATRLVHEREVSAALRPNGSSRSITLLPPLARRLGRTTPRLYPALARLPPLRSHRLMEWRRPPAGTSA